MCICGTIQLDCHKQAAIIGDTIAENKTLHKKKKTHTHFMVHNAAFSLCACHENEIHNLTTSRCSAGWSFDRLFWEKGHLISTAN